MIVFKTFFKILKSNLFIVILFTAMLIIFGCFSMQTNDTTTNFIAEKPDVLIINNDTDSGITKHLCEYVKSNSNIKEIENNEAAINDAIFYRDVNYVIYIPENYSSDFMKGLNPEIKIKASGDYGSSYMEMLLQRYIKVANTFQNEGYSEEDITSKIDNTFGKNINVEITSKLDTNSLSKATFFYNFSNYSILAGSVYVIAIIMSSFREGKIKKRITISSMKYSKFNLILFLANSIFAIMLWAIYVIISIVLVKDVMLSPHGLLYIINLLIFTICCLSIAFLIGNILSNKNAINGIVNVLSLGSSFLCGAFVPIAFLPDAVKTIAHILPSYWYIQNNELIATLENINFQTLEPYFINCLVLLLFTLGFVILTNIITRKLRKSN